MSTLDALIASQMLAQGLLAIAGVLLLIGLILAATDLPKEDDHV